MILNELEKKKRYYSLENEFNVFAKCIKNICFLQFWDACREQLSLDILRGRTKQEIEKNLAFVERQETKKE